MMRSKGTQSLVGEAPVIESERTECDDTRATRRLLTLCVSYLAALMMTSPCAAKEPSVVAIWKAQRASFVYVGRTTFYSCAALKRKLALVLQAIGAHEDIVFEGCDCNDGGRTRLQVTFRSPIEANPDNIRAVTTYGSTQEIIARLHGIPLPAAEDLERFRASWRDVSFAKDSRMRLSAADCEFVEHVRKQLLPHFSVRVTKSRIFCTPGVQKIRAPMLTVSALIPERN